LNKPQIKEILIMSAQVAEKKNSPATTQAAVPAAGPDPEKKTSIQLKIGTKAILEDLKQKLADARGVPVDEVDFNAVLEDLLSQAPAKASTPGEVVIRMSRQKYDWLLAFQNNIDCTRFLQAAVK
jgi:hypothetical protein